MVFARIPSGVKDNLTHQHGDATVAVPWGSSCARDGCKFTNPPRNLSYPDGYRTVEMPLQQVEALLAAHPDKGIQILAEAAVLGAVKARHPGAVRVKKTRRT
jgi:hypothetical protein